MLSDADLRFDRVGPSVNGLGKKAVASDEWREIAAKICELPDGFHGVAAGVPARAVAGMREQGVHAGFHLRLVGEDFHFAVF